jgi:pyruvate dehydrogenase E2 component (dihydrolipoamide acetyltransferase)
LVKKVLMPRLSLTMKTGTVIQWFKNEGETVAKGEPVVEVLTEKVTYEIEAPATGILRKRLVEEGVEVPVGAALAYITAPDEALPVEEITAEPTAIAPAPPETEVRREVATPQVRRRVLASPAAKRLARDYDVNLTDVQGSGPDGRIVEKDVEHLVKAKEEGSPRIKEETPLAGIRKTTAERLALSFQTAPHSYIIMDVDMSNALKLREKTNVSYTTIVVHAVAKALRTHLNVNSTLINGKVRTFEDVNIGVAVSTEKGLLVPVLRNADEKEREEVHSELGTLVENARAGKLSKEELSGGTFTITNLGMYDVDTFFPIVNPPEAAILAAGRILEKPVVADGRIAAAPMMALTLAYDHRILDGAPASIFLREVKRLVEACCE